MEGEAYLQDGRVSQERQIRILAHYLKGKSYNFYMQKVAPDDPENWDLPKFFTELFNFCFPIDYRQQMRLKMEGMTQGHNQSVSEYIHEIQEVFNMVGALTPESKVIKLWYSLRPNIQRALWRDGLHPDTSNWDEIVTKAEVIEIASKVSDPRDRRVPNETRSNSRIYVSNYRNNARNRTPRQNPTSRAVSFTPADRDGGNDRNDFQNRNSGNHRNFDRSYTSGRGQISNNNRRQPQRNARENNNRPKAIKAPGLSEKEMAELRAAGKCFDCKEIGHLSRNCPHKNNMKGSTSRPPGIPNYSIQMDLVDDQDDDQEALESMPVGMITLKPHADFAVENAENEKSDSDWRKELPMWRKPQWVARRQIGNSLALTAEYLLADGQPYPGDDLFHIDEEQCHPSFRFSVMALPGLQSGSYQITDRFLGFKIEISESLLKNTKFNLCHWYAKRRAQLLGLHDTFKSSYLSPMGDSVCDVTEHLLRQGINSYFPNADPTTDSEDRFYVFQKDLGSPIVVIIDEDLDLRFEIDRSILENPRFDLIKWYSIRLKQTGIFWNKYRQLHELFYNPLPEGEEDEFADLPGLVDVDDGEEPESENSSREPEYDNKEILDLIAHTLEECKPYPNDHENYIDRSYHPGAVRFIVRPAKDELICVYDRVHGIEGYLCWEIARSDSFSIGKWFAEQCALNTNEMLPEEIAQEWMNDRKWEQTVIKLTKKAPRPMPIGDDGPPKDDDNDDEDPDDSSHSIFTGCGYCTPHPVRCCKDNGERLIPISGIQVSRDKYPAIQRNSAKVKDKERLLPKPVVIKVSINGEPACALIDSGSMGDFVSSTLVDQLKLKRILLEKAVGLQLAVQGSRSKINAQVSVRLEYQNSSTIRQFDVININDYDLILGTPWMYQHKVSIGLNPARIIMGSDIPVPITVGKDARSLLNAVTFDDPKIVNARDELMAYADPLCRVVEETELPPLRAINHTIPLIDEKKTYTWRASKCPEIFREQWATKRDAYLRSGRWKMTTARNTVPMLLIPKPHKPKDAQELRTVYDLRERNKNTVKMTSPLPDIEGILRRVTAKRFCSVLDLTAAYEQIRIVPEHVERSAVTTPDGNMVSLVLQMGDCNAPATYQSLMNHIFSPYLNRFLDVYLDDVIVYSDTLEDHIKHCMLAMDILRKEKLYLSKKKLRFLPAELTLLGRVIDNDGIRMDPEKVDSVLKWKTPTNRDLLRGFIGSVGYLADDIPNIRLPLGVLSAITGDTVPFRWGYTEQRAFEETKNLIQQARDHHRQTVVYGKNAPQVWLVTDGCATGISGLVSQGSDWKTARIAAFYSAKLNAAQRNYPVHEIEMFAGIETMLRHRDILQGVPFKWITDHRGLIYLLNQKTVSGRQARWLEKISSFMFEVVYVPGSENVVADALSRMYSNDSAGTERVRSENSYHNVSDDDTSSMQDLQLAGIQAVVATTRPSRNSEPGAESGRPETSQEFASRMKDRFVLRGPRE